MQVTPIEYLKGQAVNKNLSVSFLFSKRCFKTLHLNHNFRRSNVTKGHLPSETFNNKRNAMRNILLVFISILIFPFAANADTNSCLLTKYEYYSEAISNYQEKLSQLVVSKNPEFTTIAKALTDAQQWRIEKNLISFKYFQKNNPDALKTDKIINRWLKSSD